MYNRRVVRIWSKCMCAHTVNTTIDVRQSHLCQEFLTVYHKQYYLYYSFFCISRAQHVCFSLRFVLIRDLVWL